MLPTPPSTGVWRFRADVWALLFFALMTVGLFRLHLVGRGTFIGDSDRLNNLLNIRTFEVRTLQHRGALAWNENEFMGFDAYGLPWVSIVADPIAHLEALFPITHLFLVAGFAAAILMLLAAWSAYLYLKEACGSLFPALVGASLYALSFAAILRIGQNDATFAVLILIPLGLVALRRVKPGSISRCFLGLTVVITLLLGFTFLQEAAYACLLFGSYAAYRNLRVRSWLPSLVFAKSLIISMIFSAPRLITILDDYRLLARTSSFFTTCWCEFFRWFNDGIFGRFQSEARALHNGLNLHEGLQLYASTFSTMLVLIGVLRIRGRAGTGSAVMFFTVLGWVLSPWIGLGGSAAVAIGLIGLYLTVGKIGGPFVGEDLSVHDTADVPFHLFIVAFVLAVVLIEPMRYVFYLAFLGVDFTHSRLSIAALLPEFVLVGVLLRDSIGVTQTRGTLWSTLVQVTIALVAAAATVWAVDAMAASSSMARLGLSNATGRLANALAASYVTAHLGLIPPPGWSPVPPKEIMRVVWAGVIFAVLCGGLCAARRVWPVRRTLAYWLGFAMLFQAWAYADLQLSGPQTWTFPVPFKDNDFLNVAPAALRPPADRAIAELQRRLETDHYRAVLVANPNAFPAFVAPHVSQFWGLRLVEGYASGIPRRLAQLPWPDDVLSLRALSFPDAAHLPWSLLSVLNVKYAVVVNPALYYNLAGGRIQPGSAMPVDDLEIIQNPLPVTPRAFFAESLRQVASAPVSPQSGRSEPPTTLMVAELRADLPADPTKVSFVEGTRAPARFTTAGAIQADYRGDTIEIRVDPSDRPRFLVLNELYHPAWRAFSGGRELRIYPTNIVMRGLVVPPGITEIRFKFIPYFLTPAALLFVSAGLVLLSAAWWFSRRLDATVVRSSRAERGDADQIRG